MAHRNYLIIAGIAAATALAACSTTVTGSAEDAAPSAAIRFAAAPTKAAVISEAGMDAFAVWGWYRDDATTTPVPVFDATPVTLSSGQWTYDGTRYWLLGKTYNFTALHPADLPAGTTVEATADGSITIEGFDATQSRDLMTASVSGINYATVDDIKAVGFTFSHLLARVAFVGNLDAQSVAHVPDMSATIHEAKLYGMSKTGTYVSTDGEAKWTRVEATTEGAPFASRNTDITLTTEGVSVFDDLLLIPETVGQEFCIYVKYSVNGGETREQVIPLNSLVGTFEAGKSYRFTFTVVDEDHILFDRPTVNNWNDASGGIVVIE